MTRVALFPGSFDPVHNGHVEVLNGACRLFDHVVMAPFDSRSALFALDERVAMLRDATAHLSNVTVRPFAGLVVDVAREVGAIALVRGLRAVSDFESELQMAQMNHHLTGIDTVFVPTSSERSFLASRLIREVAGYGADVSGLVPAAVAGRVAERFGGPGSIDRGNEA